MSELHSLLHTIDAVTTDALMTAPRGFALYPNKMTAPLLYPLPDGSGLLLEDWTYALTQTFYVPATQMDGVRRVLELSQAE